MTRLSLTVGNKLVETISEVNHEWLYVDQINKYIEHLHLGHNIQIIIFSIVTAQLNLNSSWD